MPLFAFDIGQDLSFSGLFWSFGTCCSLPVALALASVVAGRILGALLRRIGVALASVHDRPVRGKLRKVKSRRQLDV